MGDQIYLSSFRLHKNRAETIIWLVDQQKMYWQPFWWLIHLSCQVKITNIHPAFKVWGFALFVYILNNNNIIEYIYLLYLYLGTLGSEKLFELFSDIL